MLIVQLARQLLLYFVTMDQMFELLRSLGVVVNHPLSKSLISRDFFLQSKLAKLDLEHIADCDHPDEIRS